MCFLACWGQSPANFGLLTFRTDQTVDKHRPSIGTSEQDPGPLVAGVAISPTEQLQKVGGWTAAELQLIAHDVDGSRIDACSRVLDLCNVNIHHEQVTGVIVINST